MSSLIPPYDADEYDEGHSEGDTLGPCGCVDYHLADCDGSAAPTKYDYLDRYGDLDVDDWPDSYD